MENKLHYLDLGCDSLVIYTVGKKIVLVETAWLNSRIKHTQKKLEELHDTEIHVQYIDGHIFSQLLRWTQDDNIKAYSDLSQHHLEELDRFDKPVK